MGKKYVPTQERIRRFINIFGIDHYDYSLITEIKNSQQKIQIRCKIHDFIFTTNANKHQDRKQGCSKCKFDKLHKIHSHTKEQFIEDARKVHGDKYDYSKFDYHNGTRVGIIICKTCGKEFSQRANGHKTGKGCLFCSGRQSLSHEEFLIRATKVHGNDFEYPEKYNGADKPIKIIHKKCGASFQQTPYKHIKRKQGCPHCKQPHGEKSVKLFLEANGIQFIQQKSFPDCKHIKKLRFDFYLPDLNCCIEYDGDDHYEPTEKMIKLNPTRYSTKSIEYNRLRDKIKNEYCRDNSIRLIRIPYWNENKIPEILVAELLSAA